MSRGLVSIFASEQHLPSFYSFTCTLQMLTWLRLKRNLGPKNTSRRTDWEPWQIEDRERRLRRLWRGLCYAEIRGLRRRCCERAYINYADLASCPLTSAAGGSGGRCWGNCNFLLLCRVGGLRKYASSKTQTNPNFLPVNTQLCTQFFFRTWMWKQIKIASERLNRRKLGNVLSCTVDILMYNAKFPSIQRQRVLSSN